MKKFLKNYGYLIILFLLGIIGGAYFYKQGSKNSALREENNKLRHRMNELIIANQHLHRLQTVESGKRKEALDSITKLTELSQSLEQELNQSNRRYEKIKIDLLGIDTDDKRDSILSVWYPSPGQRHIRPKLEN